MPITIGDRNQQLQSDQRQNPGDKSWLTNPGDRRNDHRMQTSDTQMNNCNGYMDVTRLLVTRLLVGLESCKLCSSTDPGNIQAKNG